MNLPEEDVRRIIPFPKYLFQFVEQYPEINNLYSLVVEFALVARIPYIVLQAECFSEYLSMNKFPVVVFFDCYQYPHSGGGVF